MTTINYLVFFLESLKTFSYDLGVQSLLEVPRPKWSYQQKLESLKPETFITRTGAICLRFKVSDLL